jgi:transglutaminase-like putative cysteine protease
MPLKGRAAEYTIGPAPAWVIPARPGTISLAAASQDSFGEVYLLADTQVLASNQQYVAYRRLVINAINASGVNAVANIQIRFDPSYQTLQLHAINIVRNGHIIPKLASARIQVLQRESALEAQIYDGTKTVNIFLDDVREGDTVDYSYSTSGRNPVFKGQDFGAVLLQYPVPVARIYSRLLVPGGKRINFAERNTSIQPTVHQRNGLLDYVWDVANPPALKLESGTPFWYMPYAEVTWSEFADWQAVAGWAQPLYQVPETLSPELQAQVDRIAKIEKTPAGRMLAALRLVQGEVRYLGVEIGQNSHAPNPPALVYARRFGDCKDKTLLLLTLLQHLGIDAHAALVNTALQRGLADVQPSPGAFDHVLVQARIDRRAWWIDPTRYPQKAGLGELYQPDYGLALIVDSQTEGLTAMPRADAGSSARQENVVFDAHAGFDKPVRYTLKTTTTGVYAEAARARLASTNIADVEKSFLNFRATYYPHIKLAAPLQIKDDETENQFATNESYTIPEMVQPSSDGKQRVAEFLLPDISQVLHEPPETVRKSPLRLIYPHDVSQRTEVLLPASWPLKPQSTVIDDPAFHFEQSTIFDGSRLVIIDRYRALTDEVPAEDMPRYVGNLARARAVVGYQLVWSNQASTGKATTPTVAPSGFDRTNWPLVLLALASFGFWVWMATNTYKYDPEPNSVYDKRWVGISGWLVLLTIGLLIRPLIYAKNLWDLAGIMDIGQWSRLTTYGGHAYNAMWAPALLLELINTSGQLVFSSLLLLLLFKHRSNFPRTAIWVLISGAVVHIVIVSLVAMIPNIKTGPQVPTQAAINLVGAVLWSIYLFRSERVEATFVRRYRTAVSAALTQPATEASS